MRKESIRSAAVMIGKGAMILVLFIVGALCIRCGFS
jgi:hypothetical protein